MKSENKPTPKLIPSQKKELKRRIYALRGKYKGKRLLKALMAEKARKEDR